MFTGMQGDCLAWWTNYYCSEHFPSHLDLLPVGDLEYSSTNEGLERYMDEIDDSIDANEGLDDNMDACCSNTFRNNRKICTLTY